MPRWWWRAALRNRATSGAYRASAGDVLVHPALDCHANQMVSAGVRLIRLNWSDAYGAAGLYRANDVDALARAAEKDLVFATFLLKEALKKSSSTPGQKNDWPDLLAADLAHSPLIEIGAWAEANGMARETVSRGFAAAYGIAPKVFRAELRTRAAWLRVTRSCDRLSSIAAETGFADQAHMTRWIQPPYWGFADRLASRITFRRVPIATSDRAGLLNSRLH